MEKLISSEKYIEMGKVKVVPVEQEAPIEVEQPTPVEAAPEQAPEPVAETLAIELL